MSAVELGPGIAEPICGWEWLEKHRHDLDGWRPCIELISEHGRYKVSGKPKQVTEAIKEYTRRR